MNKAEMIKEVAKRLDGCTKADVQAVIETYVDVVKETLENDVTDTVILPGLANFDVNSITGYKNQFNDVYKEEAYALLNAIVEMFK